MSTAIRLPGRLSDQAYAHLRRDIIRGDLAPGEEITEAQLTERCLLGKAPIRSALIRLAQEGLVRPMARRGYLVSAVTIADIQEIFQMRLVLEPLAARLAAGNVHGENLLRIEQLLRAAYEPGDRDSQAAFLDANRDFHLAVAEASGNRRLAESIGRLLDETDRILHLGLASDDLGERFQHEHRELLEALLAGDAVRAEEVAFEALKGGQRMVLAAVIADPRVVGEHAGRDEACEG